MATILSRKSGGSGGGGGAPSGPAGGSLAGTYPNPTIAAGAVDTAELANDSVDGDKIDGADAADIRTVLDVPSNSEAILDSIIDAKGDLLAGTAADTVARVAVGATNGMVLEVASGAAPGMQWDLPAGWEYNYTEITSSVACTATTEATANTVVTAGAVTFSGTEIVLIEFYCPLYTATAAVDCFLWLYDGASSIGRIHQSLTGASNAGISNIYCARRLTPSGAAHTYSIRGSLQSAGTFTVLAGGGGAGGLMPAFIRLTKAA